MKKLKLIVVGALSLAGMSAFADIQCSASDGTQTLYWSCPDGSQCALACVTTTYCCPAGNHGDNLGSCVVGNNVCSYPNESTSVTVCYPACVVTG